MYMGNRQSINIKAMNKCLTAKDPIVVDGTPLVMRDCDGEITQEFTYNPRSKEIKYGTRCVGTGEPNLERGSQLRLLRCDGSDNQKWVFHDTSIANEVDPTLCFDVRGSSLQSGTPVQLWTCNNQLNQQFHQTTPQAPPIAMPRILRTELVIPEGTIPSIQQSILPPHMVLFMNNKGKGILIPAGSVINQSSKEIQCLGDVSAFVLGPLSVLRIFYKDEQGISRFLLFKNMSLEHDLIYDFIISFSPHLKNIMKEVQSYEINSTHDALLGTDFTIDGTTKLDKNIVSGAFLVSKYTSVPGTRSLRAIDLNQFSPPDYRTIISRNMVKDYIVGPYTMVTLGNINLYNSSDKPLLYRNLQGVHTIYSNIRISPAAPLTAGYVRLHENCNYSGKSITVIIGDYSIDTRFGTSTIHNINIPPDIVHSSEDPVHPFSVLEEKKIGSLSVGPYTRITLYQNPDFSGKSKVFENNSYQEINYNLCMYNFDNMTSAFIIEYTDSYVGYGIINRVPIVYRPQSYHSACPPPLAPTPSPPTPPPPRLPIKLGRISLSSPSPVRFIPNATHQNASPMRPEAFQVISPPGPGVRAPNDHINTLSSDSFTSLEVPYFRNINFDCQYYPLSGIYLSSNGQPLEQNGQSQPTYRFDYYCYKDVKYDTIGSQQTSFVVNSPSDLTEVNINCGSKAIISVKTTVDGNRVTYDYNCGNQDLSNITTYRTGPFIVSDSKVSLASPRVIYLMCDLEQLVSFKINKESSMLGDASPINTYYYQYQCGNTKENFDLIDDSEKLTNIIYRFDDREHHIACPLNTYQNMQIHHSPIQLSGNNVLVRLKRKDGSIDTYYCHRDKPITIDNRDYVGIMIERFPKQPKNHLDYTTNRHKIEHFSSHSCDNLALALVLLMIFLLALFVWKRKK